MSEDEGSRANRLRNRRASRSESKTDESSETGEPSEPSEPSKPSKPSESSKPSKTDETDEPDETDKPSIKQAQVGTYMYIPESQKKEIQRLYNVMKAEYEYKYEQDFEKNRHFYPLLVQYGLEGLDGLDASEIQTRLDEL